MTQKPTGVFVQFPLTEAQVSAYSGARAKAWVEQGKPTTTSTFEAALLAIGTPVTGRDLIRIATIVWFPNDREPVLGSYAPTAFKCGRGVPVVSLHEAQAQIAARDAEIVRLRDVINKMTSMSMNSGAWLSNNRIANCRDELSAMTRLGSNTLKGGAA